MKRQRTQKGEPTKRGGFWVLRYRETINLGGDLVTQQKLKRLGPIAEMTKKQARSIAQEEISKVNDRRRTPETVTTMGHFVTAVYLPFVKAQKRPSTAKGYRDMWEDHLKARCESVLLRTVETNHVQRWLQAIADQDRTRTGKALSHETMKHLKSFVSGIFRHAKQQGPNRGKSRCGHRRSAVPEGTADLRLQPR